MKFETMNLRTIVLGVIKFLFLRIDFLNKSIYVTVAVFVREVAAIGFGEGVLELTTEIKQQPSFNGWKYWSLRVLEVFLVGGSWIIVSILAVLLIVLIYVKIKTRQISNFTHLFNSQLRSIQDIINDFKPTTANTLLKKFLQDVEDSYISDSDRQKLKAKAYHLLGVAQIDVDDEKSSFKYHIQAFKFNPAEFEFKERASVSYYFMDDKEKASSLALEILKEDKSSERANAMKLYTDTTFSLEQVPSQTKKGLIFSRFYLYSVMDNGKDGEDKAKSFLAEKFEKQELPSAITFENIGYWGEVGRFAYYLGTQAQPNSYSSGKEDYKENKLIVYSNKVLSMIYQATRGTEAFETQRTYKFYAFYYFQTEYLLTGASDAVTEMVKLYNTTFQKATYAEDMLASILPCLNQLKRYNEVVALSQTLADDVYFKHVMEFHAYSSLEMISEAFASATKYVKGLEVIDDLEVNNLLGTANFIIQNKLDAASFYSDNIQGKQFLQEIDKEILFCYFHRYIPEKQLEIESKIESILKAYPSLRFELKGVALVSLFVQQKFEIVLQLIGKYHNWREEVPVIFIYTESLLALKNDSDKLLEALKFRRTHYRNQQLLSEEILIYELIESSNEILEITAIGRTYYSDNPSFEFYHILSLYKLKKSELLDFLNDNLFNFDFRWKQKFVLARICIENKKSELGLELFYRQTVDSNNPIIKQNYFILTTLIEDRKDIPWPSQVEVDTWVRITTESDQGLIRVNEETIKSNWIAKAVLGLKLNESTNVTDPLTHKKNKVTAVQIFDKYSGLAAEIAEEIGKSEFTGMGIRSIKFGSASTEEITKALIEAFGEAGDRDKIRRDEAFKKYYSGEYSFTELVRSISRDKVLQTLSYLTSSQSDGFRVIPIRDFNNFQINHQNEFVIDFTSLPILKYISENTPNVLKHKYIISQFAIELLENELTEARSMQEEGMSVHITSSNVIPSMHPPGYKQHAIETLGKILKWINDNCEIRQSKEKLDMILQHPKMIRENDLYYNYFIDTMFIAIGRTLISDDSLHTRNFRTLYPTVSLEYYLNFFYKENFNQSMLPVLIQNHYVGIRLNHPAIRSEFKKTFYGGKSTFHYCLENLPFSVNHDVTVFNEALDFIKYIYSEEMPLSHKKETSQKVLVQALKTYPNPLNLRKNLINEIYTRFHLLQLYLPEVHDDFTVAFDILYKTHS